MRGWRNWIATRGDAAGNCRVPSADCRLKNWKAAMAKEMDAAFEEIACVAASRPRDWKSQKAILRRHLYPVIEHMLSRLGVIRG
jgi:hypothetical protein